jgi:hypothetical protein
MCQSLVEGYRAIAAIGKSMVTRSTSANKRLEFRAALHNGARKQSHQAQDPCG